MEIILDFADRARDILSVTQLIRILMDRIGKGATLKKLAARFLDQVRLII